MSEMFDRTKMLIGEEAFLKLQNSHVVIFGVGGVGGSAAESLIRSGIGKLTIVDFDLVDPSNLNRQLLFSQENIGQKKVFAAKNHLLALNPKAEIIAIEERVGEEFFLKHPLQADYFIDAVDDIYAKAAIARYCIENQQAFLASLGMGNRLIPGGFKQLNLNQTQNDPLARKLRHFFKEKGIDLKKVPCVQALNGPDVVSQTPASMMFVPSSAGLFISACAIKHLVKSGKED